MSTLFLIKDGKRGLYPASKASAMELEKLPDGAEIECKSRHDRSSAQHRMAFSLFTYLADALNDGPGDMVWDQDTVRRRLLVVTGHADVIPLTDKVAKQWGTRLAVVPRSMSFEKMDGRTFGEFLNASMDYVRTELAPWIEDSGHWGMIEAIVNAGLTEAA